ncbi:pleckstrin homology domain-containing family A member 1 [Platysternon megacephalum]|uniref:Pleckstrin homology domain-containing family A member 1 n=1 Tax=Platysternon megacephalum TaxID=55544 RepID=A0A4D9EH38_9SAUR|nr:pleckstrin homology domain-containing family A member 1 [Platysternon megacephalum]
MPVNEVRAKPEEDPEEGKRVPDTGRGTPTLSRLLCMFQTRSKEAAFCCGRIPSGDAPNNTLGINSWEFPGEKLEVPLDSQSPNQPVILYRSHGYREPAP